MDILLSYIYRSRINSALVLIYVNFVCMGMGRYTPYGQLSLRAGMEGICLAGHIKNHRISLMRVDSTILILWHFVMKNRNNPWKNRHIIYMVKRFRSS